MEYTYMCNRFQKNCNFQIRTKSRMEVLSKINDHLKTAHKLSAHYLNTTPMKKKIESCISQDLKFSIE